MSYRPQVNPATIHPLGDRVLVTNYQRPSEAFGLHLPDTYQTDTTMTLWEVVVAAKEAEDAVGMLLPPGCILQTLRRWPVDSGLADLEGRPLYFLSASVEDAWGGNIRSVVIY